MINLLPDEMRESIRFTQSVKKVVNITSAVLGVIGFAIAIEMAGLALLNNAKDEVNVSIAEKEAIITEFNDNQSEAIQLSKDIDTVKALIDRQADFSKLVREIGKSLPVPATLSSLTLGDTVFEQMQLQLTVDTQERAAIARQNIEESPIFAGADILSISAGETDQETEEILNRDVTISTRLCKNFKSIIQELEADPNAEVSCE
jgi:hypothetical protein